MSLADAVASAPRRQLSGRFWHQGPTRHRLTSCADPAPGPGRYHRRGDAGVWYAFSEDEAAQLAVSEHDLVGDDYSVTQAIASAARNAGFDGVLAPAAALPGRNTLAVFAHALSSVISV